MKLLIDQIQTYFLVLLICQAACVQAVSIFCKKHLLFRKTGHLLFPVCLFLGLILLNLFGMSYGAFHFSYLLFVLLKHLLFMGAVLWFCQENAAKKLLTASVLITVLTLAENFCESFLSCLTLLFLHTVQQIPEPILGESETVLILCIRTVFVILVLLWTSVHFDPKILFFGRTGRWHMLLAAPLLGITTVTDIANWGACHGILVRSSAELSIYYDQLFSHGEMCILTALSMFAAGCYLFGMNKICLEQRKSSQYHAQIAAYKMLEEQYHQSERLRHDMKNHIIALSGLLEQEELEKSRNYLKNMEQNANLGTGEEATGNSAVDALLYQKRKLAEQHQVCWECDVQVPPSCGIPEFDLCVLFGNLLDNTLNACIQLPADRERFIHVQAGLVKQCFLLEVKNSMETKKKEMVLSEKNQAVGRHGIGLLNVQDVIRRYNGTWKIVAEDEVFIITLLLPMRPMSRT